MLWFLVYLLLFLGYIVATLAAVPAANLRAYKLCHKPLECRIVAWLGLAIPFVALAQQILDPFIVRISVRMLGLGMFVVGSWLTIWARRVNPSFLPIIRRPLFVVKFGPYRVFDHPGYLGMGFGAMGLPLLLGSRWSLLPVACYVALLLRRMWLEDRLLSS